MSANPSAVEASLPEKDSPPNGPSTSPRSPKGERRTSKKDLVAHQLEDKLLHRPDTIALEKRQILPSHSTTVAPSIQATQKQLERQMTSDSVSHLLENRPEPRELESQGLLDTSVTPRLSSMAKQLERKIQKDNVKHMLEKRPALDDLVAHAVVDESVKNIAPSLQASKNQLEKKITADKISHHLRIRPSMLELEEQGLSGLIEGRPESSEQKRDLTEEKEEEQEGQAERERQAEAERDRGIDNGYVPLSLRERYAIALQAVAYLAKQAMINESERKELKKAILRDDQRIQAIVECYEMGQDKEEMADTLYRLAKLL